MLNVILIIAFVGVIVVSIIFAGMTFLQGVQATLDAQITHQRLLEVATQIQSHGRIVGGTFALPQGANGSSPYAYNQVPSWITSNAVAANGVPFEYCPYASVNNGGTSGTITMGDGSTTYNIKYTNSAATISQNYVTDNNGTTVPFSSAIGLLVAAAPNRYYPPNCSAVSTSNGYPVVTGGIAVSIQNDYLNKTRLPAAMTDFSYYVSTAATGDGSGRDTGNYTTLSKALSAINTLSPASAIIYLNATGSPTYSTSDSLSHGTRILLSGSGGSGATINTSGNITIDEYSMLALNNLTLTVNSGSGTLTVNGLLEMASGPPAITATAINIYGGKITDMSGVTLSAANITLDGGAKVESAGGTLTFNSLGNRGLKIINGTLTHNSAAQFGIASSGIVPVFIGAGGALNIGNGATATINYANASAIAGGMVIDPGGRLITEGTLQIDKASSYGIYLHGILAMENASNISSQIYYGGSPTDGVVLASGARMAVDQGGSSGAFGQASHANDPTNAIDDKGGSIITSYNSENFILNATTNCWLYSSAPQGFSLFTDSPTGTVNGHASTTNNTIPWLRLYNNSDVTCNIN